MIYLSFMISRSRHTKTFQNRRTQEAKKKVNIFEDENYLPGVAAAAAILHRQ